jgi:hypothetical protein
VAGNGLSNEEIKRASVIIQSQNFPTLSIRPETYNYVVKDADLMGTKSNSPNQSVVVLTNLLGIAKIIPQALVAFTIFILLTLYLRFRRRSVDSSENEFESGSENATVSLFESQFEKMRIAPHLYDLTFLTLVSFVLAIIGRSSGLIGKFYNTDRLALQMGMIWTLPLAIVLTILFSHFKWGKLLSVVLILCAVIQLNLQLGFLNVLRDDFTDKITAKNWQANSYNVSKEMFTTQKWIVGKIRKNDFLQSDCTNFVSFGKFTVKGYLYKQSMPYNLDSGAFIYAGPNNLRENIYYDCSGKVFEYPISFVETYYSPVYVSDSTAVFR